MDPLRYCDDLPLPPNEEILGRLAGRAGREALVETLRLLCPCRNICRDPEIWRAVLSLYGHHRREVREGAHHAVMSLRERARIDTRTYELLRSIGVGPGQRRHQWRWASDPVRKPRMVRNDVPTLIEMLASDDPLEHADALAALFAPRASHVAGSIWRELERSAQGNDRRLRVKAEVAIRRIKGHRAAAA